MTEKYCIIQNNTVRIHNSTECTNTIHFVKAETCGGLAVCQPLTRISNHHQQGESPAEEVSTGHTAPTS